MANPELGEYVVVTVRKIMPYGAFCTLDEYADAEAFLHISEISSGWIRNIREHVKEGQKTVCKVIRLDPEKHQVDLSLKRVTEADRKRKLEAFQSEKRAVKLLERAALKLKKSLRMAQDEAGLALAEEYGDLYSAMEALAAGQEPKSKVSKAWIDAIREIVSREIKPKVVEGRAILTLQSFAGNGVSRVKSALEEVKGCATHDVKISVHYVGAPVYYLDFSAPDYKSVEKVLDKAEDLLEKSAKKNEFEYSLERPKK